VVLAGSQLAFGYEAEDARLAFQRLARTLEHEGSSLANVAALSYYSLSRGIAEQAGKIAAGLLDPSRPPAITAVSCVGLPALDAAFGVDAVAIPSTLP
jgi:enamine deaminase RidA (YjgF/YER057c/UK114 family)